MQGCAEFSFPFFRVPSSGHIELSVPFRVPPLSGTEDGNEIDSVQHYVVSY